MDFQTIITFIEDAIRNHNFYLGIASSVAVVVAFGIPKLIANIILLFSNKTKIFSFSGWWLAFDPTEGSWSQPNIDVIKAVDSRNAVDIKMWLYSHRLKDEPDGEKVCNYLGKGISRSNKVVFYFEDTNCEDSEIGSYVIKLEAQNYIGPYVLFSTRTEHASLDISNPNRLMVRIKIPFNRRLKAIFGKKPYDGIDELTKDQQKVIDSYKDRFKKNNSLDLKVRLNKECLEPV